MKSKLIAAVHLSRVLVLSGCMAEVIDEPAEHGEDSDDLIVDENAKWPDRKNVPVCFTSGNGTSAREQATRKLIESEFAKVGICFSGWGACTTSTPCPAIRLEIGPDDGSGAAGWSYVGPTRWMCSGADRTDNNMWLRTDQTDWAAVHEFTHAIGLHHEHGRTDNDGHCPASGQEQIPEGGSIHYIGAYDPDSVTNYCSGKSRLSPNDISGIKEFYKVGNDLSCGGGGGVATLYQHCSYTGWQVTLAPGDYTTAQLVALGAINNDASSLRIPPGYEATLYDGDNFTGTSITVTADSSCFVASSFNDRLSSLRLRAVR